MTEKLNGKELPSLLNPEKIHTMVFNEGIGVLENFASKEWCKILIDAFEMYSCLLYTSPSPRDLTTSRMPSSA